MKNQFPGVTTYLTSNIPAVKCTIRSFEVFEVPKFAPTGAGPHTWSLVEKRGITTPQLVQLISNQINSDPRDISYAGLKDKHARTIQWISSPKPFTLISQCKVIVSKPSQRKLRPGTLYGNWFKIELETNEPQKVIEVIKLIEPAVPNLFGPQRFGNRRNNHELGQLLINGNKKIAKERMKHARIPFTRRFYRFMEDAYLSYIFNQIVNERMPDTELHDYDVKSKYGPTAPMFGRLTRFAKGQQGELERKILESEGLNLAPLNWDGGRRPMFVPLKGLQHQLTPTGVLLKFFLPKGSYATSVLREITKEGFTLPSL
ncbi:MAG: tRNA pseudouridine(13) synthase TruD, partial [Candidatus Altiarchaeota archaeon]|nr:tRNA pseudouridine(13) synthase TruD [Candidatus Altiarchaeota archaeon]